MSGGATAWRAIGLVGPGWRALVDGCLKLRDVMNGMTNTRRGGALMRRRVALAALLLGLGGCTVGPDFSGRDWASPSSWFPAPPSR